MSSEIKIVISLKDDKGSIGLQSPDCDPIFRTFEGNLEQGLGMLPGLIEEANRKWDENPRNPKCTVPPPSEIKPAAQTSSVRRPVSKGKPDSKAQPVMF